MNRSMRTSASLIALSLALAGCSTSLFESKRIDYKSAKQMPQTLEIPPDLTAPTRDDRFAVPDVSPRGVATFSAYNADRSAQPSAAGAADVLATPDTMRIERAGSQRGLVRRRLGDRARALAGIIGRSLVGRRHASEQVDDMARDARGKVFRRGRLAALGR